MTVAELYARALERHPKLRPDAHGRVRWYPSNLERWLDERVDAGWLEKIGDRYYLTDEGYAIAGELSDLTVHDRVAA